MHFWFKTACRATGVGKTTCAVMACNECSLPYVEMNASDVRNKKVLEASAFEMLSSRQIGEFFSASKTQTPSKEGLLVDVSAFNCSSAHLSIVFVFGPLKHISYNRT